MHMLCVVWVCRYECGCVHVCVSVCMCVLVLERLRMFKLWHACVFNETVARRERYLRLYEFFFVRAASVSVYVKQQRV